MKNLFRLLMLCMLISTTSFAQQIIKVPYDSTFSTTHDTTKHVIHDTTKLFSKNVTVFDTSVTSTQVRVCKRRLLFFKRCHTETKYDTSITSYIQTNLYDSLVKNGASHDSLFRNGITHDTTVLRYRDSIVKKTSFGASGPTISSTDILKAICGVPSVTRTAIILDEYTGGGSREADKYLSAGVTVFINCNLSTVKKDAQGNKIPNPFPTDTNYYKSKLLPVFEYYKNNAQKSKIIMVCENEPTTANFHTGPMSDYLRILKIFVRLGKQYGYKCVDGGVHVATVNGSDLTNVTGEGKASQVAELLAGYATIKDLYAVNLHTSNTSDNYNSQSTVTAVQKIWTVTGHRTVSNEWHAQNTTDPNVLLQIAKGWYDSGVEYSVYITGTSDKNADLNSAATLTPFGVAYKNFISSH
jgi:hypothetical protein